MRNFSIITDEAQKSLRLSCASNHITKLIVIMTKAIIKSFRFSFKPNKTQSQKLNDTLYLCQQLYNASLQERIEAYKINRISINYQHQQNQLPAIKETNPEYKNIHSQVLQNVLKRVDLAFQAFFQRIKRREKAGFPRFRSVNRYDSFTFTQSGFSLTGNKLTLSKLGTVKLKLSRQIVGKVKTCQIKRELNQWFVIFTVETKAEPLPKTGQIVGLDMGISAFAALSDGTQIDNFKYYESTQKRLRVAQRSVARKEKGSNSRKKAVFRLRKIHQKIKNQRKDFQHKVSTHLVKTYDVICIEKLSVLALSRGILSKQMNDVAIGNFFNMLRYKAVSAGKEIIEVQPHFTSQDCSSCGERVKKDLSVRVHYCSKCGLILDRDVNAAKNILALGQSVESVKWAVAPCLLSESPFITVSV